MNPIVYIMVGFILFMIIIITLANKEAREGGFANARTK